MDAVVLFYRTLRAICVLLPSAELDVGEEEQRDAPPAGALPDEPVVRDAAAEALAELLAAVLADVPRARDELLAVALVDALRVQDGTVRWVRVPVELVAPDAKAEERDGLLGAALAGVPRAQDEAELSVSVRDEPAALAAVELWAWTPAAELARLDAAGPDEFPDERMAPDDSLAFEPALDVAPLCGSQVSADVLLELVAGIAAEPAGFRERA